MLAALSIRGPNTDDRQAPSDLTARNEDIRERRGCPGCRTLEHLNMCSCATPTLDYPTAYAAATASVAWLLPLPAISELRTTDSSWAAFMVQRGYNLAARARGAAQKVLHGPYWSQNQLPLQAVVVIAAVECRCRRRRLAGLVGKTEFAPCWPSYGTKATTSVRTQLW